jgi:hypothetical protein
MDEMEFYERNDDYHRKNFGALVDIHVHNAAFAHVQNYLTSCHVHVHTCNHDGFFVHNHNLVPLVDNILEMKMDDHMHDENDLVVEEHGDEEIHNVYYFHLGKCHFCCDIEGTYVLGDQVQMDVGENNIQHVRDHVENCLHQVSLVLFLSDDVYILHLPRRMVVGERDDDDDAQVENLILEPVVTIVFWKSK